MIFIILGPSGCGKGTQAELLARELGIPHISTGKMFREELEARTPEGVDAFKNWWGKGLWVPTKLTWKLLRPRLEKALPKGFVLEGWPRVPDQPQVLDDYLKVKGLKVDRVFYLDTSDETAIKRIQKRVGLSLKEGKKPRKDETLPVIKERLKSYHKTISPILAYYRQRRILEGVDNEQPIGAVYQGILSRIGGEKKS